ncbi:head-tail connector protein [Sphingomonas aquatilis]
MRVVVVEQALPVLSLVEAKEHLAVDSDDNDALIAGYLDAATAHIDGPDGWLGRSIGVQTLEARCDVFRDAMQLSYGPVLDIVSVDYLTPGGTAAVVAPVDYEVRGWILGSAFGRRWPAVGAHPEAVRIKYRAGYDDVPPAIKAAILLMTGDLFRNRDTVAATTATQIPMSTTVMNLLAPFRVWR